MELAGGSANKEPSDKVHLHIADDILGAPSNPVGEEEDSSHKLSKKQIEFWAKQDVDHS